MIYVCSDIHGRYDFYCKMLEKINFQESDMLYILGDVVDRNAKGGIDILQNIMKRKNIQLLLGNHELYFINGMQKQLDITEGVNKCRQTQAMETWLKYNGGTVTYENYCTLNSEDQLNIYNYVYSRPLIKIVILGDKAYHLSHSGTIELVDKDEYLISDLREKDIADITWKSPFRYGAYYMPLSNYKEDFTYIVGHVPVQRAFNRSSIARKANIIDIDCGCALPIGSMYARLSCLRLDDMKEFYVGEDNIDLD